MDKTHVNRRTFVKQSASIVLGSATMLSGIPLSILDNNQGVFQAMCTCVGDIKQHKKTLLVWTFLLL